jgi:uncharacterized membrane protein (DUF373 family)
MSQQPADSSPIEEPALEAHPSTRPVRHSVLPLLEQADAVVYILVGLIFLLAAFGMLGYTVISFPANLARDGFPLAIITAVNDLLLIMIIMEVLRTVHSYLDEGASSLQPFLFIAAISATRRILAVGAQMSVTAREHLSAEQFQQAMVDLGVNAGAILAIAVALYLLNRPTGQPTHPTGAARDDAETRDRRGPAEGDR